MKRWTKKEIEILRNNYEANSSEFLCRALPDRTWSTIKRKASDLKLCYQTGTSEERFWKKVYKNQKNGCWHWTGHLRGGYGQIPINGKLIGVHRFSWELHFNKIPDEMCVCHTCDNKKCVNPNHLFLGTQKDNVDDMITKNRQAKGKSQGLHKLTEDQVKQIRLLCCEGKLSQTKIGEIFHIHNTTVSRIHRNKTWRHINDDS